MEINRRHYFGSDPGIRAVRLLVVTRGSVQRCQRCLPCWKSELGELGAPSLLTCELRELRQHAWCPHTDMGRCGQDGAQTAWSPLPCKVMIWRTEHLGHSIPKAVSNGDVRLPVAWQQWLQKDFRSKEWAEGSVWKV